VGPVPPKLHAEFLQESGEDLRDYESFCGEFQDSLAKWADARGHSTRCLHVESAEGSDLDLIYPAYAHLVEGLYPPERVPGVWPPEWKYHMVAVIDGCVQDPWLPELVLPVDEYVAAAFPDQEVLAELF